MRANNNVTISSASYDGHALFFRNGEPMSVDFKQSGARSKRAAADKLSAEYGVKVPAEYIKLTRVVTDYEFAEDITTILAALAAAGIVPISE